MHAARDAGGPGASMPRQGGRAWVELGRVRRSHGQDGGLLVRLYGDDADSLLATPEVLLEGRSASIQFRIRECEPLAPAKGGQAQVHLWLEGIASRDAAGIWAGAELQVPEHALPALPEGQYYWRDLIGTTCRQRDGGVLGTVDEIWPTGANDVLVLKRSDGQALLVPALDDVLLRLDRERNELWVDLPADFFDTIDLTS